MKLNEQYILRQVANTWVVLPVGSASLDFNGMLTLNDTGAFLWCGMEQGLDRESLLNALTAEYSVDRKTAGTDLDAFIEKLRSVGCLEE